MNILIVTQRFWPENFRINDIATSLVKAGHQVTVLTGLPNYPDGTIKPEYRFAKHRKEYHCGLSIVRAREIARHHNVVFRVLNYYSFSFFATKIAKQLPNKFDVVLANELSPIMGSMPAIAYKRKHGTKVVMYEMDLWPHSLMAAGISESSLIYKYYRKISGRIYSACDKILVSTKEHIETIRSLPGCLTTDIEYLPQYAESQFTEIPSKNIETDKVHVLFAGNIGKAQSVDTVIKAAKILKDRNEFIFDIVGSGSELSAIKQLATKYSLKNVIFHGSYPVSKMNSFYEKADIMLVTLERQPYAKMTIPGKVQTYMAAGRPIVCSADGATSNLIRESGAGLAVPAENPSDLANAIIKMTKEKRMEAGKAARLYYEKHFKKEIFMGRLISVLEEYSK